MRRLGTIAVCILAIGAAVGLGVACTCGGGGDSRTALYETPFGVIKATGPVDDEGNAERIGLNNDGTPKSVRITLSEEKDKDVMLTSVTWILYDPDGGLLIGPTTQNFMPPREIEGGGQISVSIDAIAYTGEVAGLGTISFTSVGYDTEYGTATGNIPGYSEVNIH